MCTIVVCIHVICCIFATVMDSLTQIVLGAACGEAVLGKKIGNRALLFGAIGGTLPDLDVFVGRWLYTNEIQVMAFHRGFMHSFLFSVLAAFILGYLLYRLYETGSRKGSTSLKDWISLFGLSIMTHPILDSFTGYGTQLFSPFSNYRVAFDNIAVVDPLYTIPFLICLIILMCFNRSSKTRSRVLKIGIAVSSFYMILTLFNKFYVNQIFRSDLEARQIEYSRFKSQPTIFNNILWYGIAESPEAYYVAFYSILDNSNAPKQWQKLPKNHDLIKSADNNIETLVWFSDGYYSLTQTKSDNVLIFRDLRYPLLNEDDPNSSVFTFKIVKSNRGWDAKSFEPEEPSRGDLSAFWNRLKGI